MYKRQAQAHKHRVCPFELSLDTASWTDAVICDYNYVFDPNVRLKRFFAEGTRGEYLFLIDEAHNLVERGREMFSASLCKEDFLELKRKLKGRYKKAERCLEPVSYTHLSGHYAGPVPARGHPGKAGGADAHRSEIRASRGAGGLRVLL